MAESPHWIGLKKSTSESDDDEETDNSDDKDIERKEKVTDKSDSKSKIDETIIINFKNQIKSLKEDIYDIKTRIDEELTFDFVKSEDSNHRK